MPLFRRYALGMELSDSLFKLVEIRKGFRRVRLTQAVTHPLLPAWTGKRELVEQEEMIYSIRDALAGRPLHTRRVHVSLGNRHVVTGIWKIPEMRMARMRRWIEKKVFPEWDLPFDDPIFDFEPLGHVWQDGDQQEVVVAATSRAYAEELVDLIRWCGLEPVSLGLSSMNLYRWVDFADDSTLNHLAVLHLSRMGVEVSLFYQGVLQGGFYLSLSLQDHLNGHPARPDMDPLAPVLTETSQVESYGEALIEKLKEAEPEWLVRELWKPSRVWMVSGEGVDLSTLIPFLQTRVAVTIRQGPGADALLNEKHLLHSSRWLGNALSAPLGAALKGVASR
ncbi:type IV pilus biogenesis protein PilM [Salinithrix halophila]|uniref:Type IV pilus biogenesis protein PilM n=1 Tax=Salinithrix halophila TaxID=1485204 RepID=A0ABV8JEZ5_9BACL